MSKPVIILGAGGHAKVLIDILKLTGREIAGICDPILDPADKLFRAVKILGDDNVIASYSPEKIELVNGLGSIPGQTIRRDLFIKYKLQGFNFAQVVHPSAVMSPSVSLGEGAQVFAGAVINADCQIGDNVIVNSGAVVEHDCFIGSHSHLSPGSVLCGGVKIGMQCHIGAGATIIQSLEVGESSIVAAGSVLVKKLGNLQLSKSQSPQVSDLT